MLLECWRCHTLSLPERLNDTATLPYVTGTRRGYRATAGGTQAITAGAQAPR